MFIVTNISHKDIKINGKAIHVGESRKFETINADIKSLASHRLLFVEEIPSEISAKSATKKSVKENNESGSTTKILTEEGTSAMKSAMKILTE